MANFKEAHLVKVTLPRRHSAFFRAVLLTAVAALLPLPLSAADNGTSASAHPLKTAIAKYAAREAAATTTPARTAPAARAARQTGTNDPRTGGFFHSSAGMACIAVVAAGAAYAVYSASHDRIHSVARKNQ